MSILINGLILGWSVAWPPGPINAEIIRRGLIPKSEGGGFWRAWQVGLGACLGDFLWAFVVAVGAGALLNRPTVRLILGAISFVLLLILAAIFSAAAWKAFRRGSNANVADSSAKLKTQRLRGGFWLGLFFAASSPWNIGFWLAVVGSQQTSTAVSSIIGSLFLACAVVLGAVTWTIVLCVAVRSGARIFARPIWQVWTQALTALVMLYFAAKLAFQLFG